jgi:hypothetical protein
VTHYWIDDEAVDTFVATLKHVLQAAISAAAG